MAVLSCTWCVAAAAATGCYAPELPDCVVRCASGADCAPGQVCGADRLCAAPAVAGSCEPDGPSDAAGEAGADTPPTPVLVVIEISGKGDVVVDGAATCSHTAPAHTCTMSVPAGERRRLEAVADPGARFDKWTSKACEGQGETCTLTPVLPITPVNARFRDDGKPGADND